MPNARSKSRVMYKFTIRTKAILTYKYTVFFIIVALLMEEVSFVLIDVLKHVKIEAYLLQEHGSVNMIEYYSDNLKSVY